MPDGDKLLRAIAETVIEQGRKHTSGEPLYFDRYNLERAIEAGIQRYGREFWAESSEAK